MAVCPPGAGRRAFVGVAEGTEAFLFSAAGTRPVTAAGGVEGCGQQEAAPARGAAVGLSVLRGHSHWVPACSSFSFYRIVNKRLSLLCRSTRAARAPSRSICRRSVACWRGDC